MDKLTPFSEMIKPCPFCGKKPKLLQCPYADIIRCENPDCLPHPTLGIHHYYCKHQVNRLIEAWNRRDGDG